MQKRSQAEATGGILVSGQIQQERRAPTRDTRGGRLLQGSRKLYRLRKFQNYSSLPRRAGGVFNRGLCSHLGFPSQPAFQVDTEGCEIMVSEAARVQRLHDRSEERRVGKECRSRW